MPQHLYGMINFNLTSHQRYLLLLCGFAALAAFQFEILRTIIGFLVFAVLSLLGIRLAGLISWEINAIPTNKKISYLITEALAIGMLTALFVLSSVKLLSNLIPELALRFQHDAGLPTAAIARVVLFAPIAEELIFRLFIMTSTYWLFRKVFRENSLPGQNQSFLRWSFLVSAILFALAHLPGWIRVTDKFEVFGFVILLNMIASYSFSWMFYNRGIYLAIVAHFSADVFGHIIGARLMFN